MRVRIPFIFLIFIVSCSIIDDESFESREEFIKRFNIESIEVSYTRNKLTTGSCESISLITADVTNNEVGLISTIDWSLNSESKLRFDQIPSFTTSNTTFQTTILYNTDNQPTSITTSNDAGFRFESFEYSYNSIGQLSKIVSIQRSSSGITHFKTTDDLLYQEGQVSEFVRTIENSADTLTTVLNGSVLYSSGVPQVVSLEESSSLSIGVRGLRENSRSIERMYSLNYRESNDFFIDTENILGPDLLLNSPNELIENMEITLEDRETDYYRIHPFLLLTNLFSNGEDLSLIYSTDWWIINDSEEEISNVQEVVNIDFNYVVQ